MIKLEILETNLLSRGEGMLLVTHHLVWVPTQVQNSDLIPKHYPHFVIFFSEIWSISCKSQIEYQCAFKLLRNSRIYYINTISSSSFQPQHVPTFSLMNDPLAYTVNEYTMCQRESLIGLRHRLAATRSWFSFTGNTLITPWDLLKVQAFWREGLLKCEAKRREGASFSPNFD